MEKYIAENLNNFLDNYSKELFELPLPSLWNIFNHKNCKFDHKKVYDYIIKQNEENFFFLLEILEATKLTPEQVKNSIIEKDEHFGFCPFNTGPYINSIFEKFNEIQLIEGAEKKMH